MNDLTGTDPTTDRCPDCAHQLDCWCGCGCCAWWRGDQPSGTFAGEPSGDERRRQLDIDLYRFGGLRRCGDEPSDTFAGVVDDRGGGA